MTNHPFKRKLTVIFSADVKGYSRLMGEDEDATVHTLTAYRDVFRTHIKRGNGRVIDMPGDNLLAEFASVVEALRCAWEVQHDLVKRNAGLAENRRMHFRIGINLGDVIEEQGRLYGDGVNVAARLESLAAPGGIHISGTAYDQVKGKLPYGFEFAGNQRVKNIRDPVRAYRVSMGSDISMADGPLEAKKDRRFKPRIFLAVMAAMAILAVGSYIWFDGPTRSSSVKPAVGDLSEHRLKQRASIAVLPFDNLSGDAQQEYFSDGITNDIITDLSRFKDLLVIASNTAFGYKGRGIDVRKIGQELGVGYVMAGSVQKAGNAVRINVQLIDTTTGAHLWAERYQRRYEDIFRLQGEIVQAIVVKLANQTFRYEQDRAMRKRPQDLEAYDYLLRGWANYHLYTRSGNAAAHEMFTKAADLDPDYAAAYVGLGTVAYSKVSNGWTEFPRQALENAFALGQRALALDESNAAAHTLLSSVYTFQDKHALAIREAERAIELNPNDSGSYTELGWALLWSGHLDAAIQALEMALRLDSASRRNIWLHLGTANYLKQQYDQALEILEQGLIKRPDYTGYHIAMAATYARLGRREDAAQAAVAVRRQDPFFEVASYGTGFRLPAHRQAIIDGLREAGLE